MLYAFHEHQSEHGAHDYGVSQVRLQGLRDLCNTMRLIHQQDIRASERLPIESALLQKEQESLK